MTVSCRAGSDRATGRPHSRMYRRGGRVIWVKLLGMLRTGLVRWICSLFPRGARMSRRIPVSVSLPCGGRSCCFFAGVWFTQCCPPPPTRPRDTCHSVERTSRRTPLKISGSSELRCFAVTLHTSWPRSCVHFGFSSGCSSVRHACNQTKRRVFQWNPYSLNSFTLVVAVHCGVFWCQKIAGTAVEALIKVEILQNKWSVGVLDACRIEELF